MALGLARHEKKGGPNLTSQGSGQAAKAALGTETEERTGWGAGELRLILMQSSSPVKSLLL